MGLCRFVGLAGVAGVVSCSLVGTPVLAQKLEPAVIFDLGGKFDKSFNEGAYNGAERFKKETGITYREFEVSNEAQREQAQQNMVRRGVNLLIAVGFATEVATKKVAEENKNINFCIIDASVVDKKNIRSYVFKDHEGSFLVGVLASMASKTGRVGFIGGMDIPLIRNFAGGYEQGAKYARPDIEVIQNMTGTTPAAWRDPARGAELARSQFDRGVDVVYAAAGATGLGVLQAVADQGKLGIGVDSNQNHLYPGKILTSMLKRVDNAVYECMKDAMEKKWTAGLRTLGLKEDGVGWALDDNNRSLITADMQAKVDSARDEIVAGKLTVKPYQP